MVEQKVNFELKQVRCSNRWRTIAFFSFFIFCYCCTFCVFVIIAGAFWWQLKSQNLAFTIVNWNILLPYTTNALSCHLSFLPSDWSDGIV